MIIRPGQCDLCCEKTSYVAVLVGSNERGPLDVCASCLEEAREEIRQQARANWTGRGDACIDLDAARAL